MKHTLPEEIIAKRREFLFPGVHHFYQAPPLMVRGSMQYLYDSKGKEYVDLFSGVSVMNCGHCNPEIIEKSVEQMKKLQHTTTIYLTEPIVNLAERLSAILPGNIRRSFFCNSGTEANEGALLLARLHTKKRKFIYLQGGLHGRSQLTASVTGIPMWRGAPYLEDGCYEIPAYHAENPKAEEESIKALGETLSRDSDIAAMIMEPIQGNGGIILPSKKYIEQVGTLLSKHGVLLIMDEVQTGFGRTGKWFGCEHFSIIPDIISTAKALGNGYPIAAFSTTDAIAASMTIPSASTLGGHPTAAATAIGVIDYIEKYNLCSQAEKLGNFLIEGLRRLKNRFSCILDVRGIGCMVGAEIGNQYYTEALSEGQNSQESAELTDFIIESMKDRGFIIGKNGINRNVLAFQPPLVIEKQNIEDMLQQLAEVLESVQQYRSTEVSS